MIHETAFVHDTAVVDPGATIGADTKVWHFAHVSAKARIGAQCALGQNVFVADGVTIGNGVRVQNNVSLYTGVIIEDDAFLGPSCVFTNVINPRSFVSRKHEYKKTRVGKGASIGANATIVCGNTIGEYAFIGAGAVVTKPVPAFALMLGVPAVRAGWICGCGTRLPQVADVSCEVCGAEYQLDGQTCVLLSAGK